MRNSLPDRRSKRYQTKGAEVRGSSERKRTGELRFKANSRRTKRALEQDMLRQGENGPVDRYNNPMILMKKGLQSPS